MSRGCKNCNYTSYRCYRDQLGREVAARCVCNPAPDSKPVKKPEPKQAKLEAEPKEWSK